jgi:hypothetical protein
MRTITAAVCLAGLSSTSAFIAPTLPSARTNTRTTTKMMLSPDDILTGTSNLLAIVKENDVFVKNAGEYPWGSVQAPDWALPVAAIGTLSFGVLVPLFLKPGVDSFNAGRFLYTYTDMCMHTEKEREREGRRGDDVYMCPLYVS